MAILKIKHQGEVISEMSLDMEKEYIGGRAEDADIKFGSDKSISRKHIKLTYKEGSWQVEVLSKYGELYLNNKKVDSIILNENMTFVVPPFEFDFESDPSVDSVTSEIVVQTESQMHVQPEELVSDSAVNEVNNVTQELIQQDVVEVQDQPVDQFNPEVGLQESNAQSNNQLVPVEQEMNLENTFVGAVKLAPSLRMISSNGDQVVFNLKGDRWLAGRDPSNSVCIKDPRISRKQFEIEKKSGNYFVIDLGSVNGTFLNEMPLKPNQETPIRSGDKISILDISLYFELKDPSFEKKFSSLPVVSSGDRSSKMSVLAADYSGQEQQQGYVSAPQKKSTNKKEKNAKVMRLALIALIALGGLYYFLEEEGEVKEVQKVEQPKIKLTPAQEAFNALSPEKQNLVRQAFNLAVNYKTQGKYRNAKDELQKIKEYVPEYENSIALEKEIDDAIFSYEQAIKLEQEEKQRIEIEEKIKNTTEECRKLLTPNVELAQIENCLAPIMEFNPEHPSIVEIKAEAEKLIQDKMAKIAADKEYQDKVARMKAVYEKAAATAQKVHPLKAIKAFEEVIATKLPDPHGYKDKAKERIQTIRTNMENAIQEYISKSEKLKASGDLKGAILNLEKAIPIDPKNGSLEEQIEAMKNELRKQLMPIYQESVLEESLGDVDSAKIKWKKILESDVPSGEYYIKASVKLKKYGVL